MSPVKHDQLIVSTPFTLDSRGALWEYARMTKLMQFLEENTKPKISALELAHKLRIHPSLITLWRQGARKPGKSKLKALSRITGIPIEDLLQ